MAIVTRLCGNFLFVDLLVNCLSLNGDGIQLSEVDFKLKFDVGIDLKVRKASRFLREQHSVGSKIDRLRFRFNV